MNPSFQAFSPSSQATAVALAPRRTGILMMMLLASVSAMMWLVTVYIFRANPALLALALAAYAFGLRHALDADHIAAIDGITRRQVADARPSAFVGLQFSLGHSTVVLGLALALIAGAHQAEASLPRLMAIGGLLGGVISAGLLLLVGGANIWSLLNSSPNAGQHAHGRPGGLLTWLFRRTYRYTNSGWKVFMVGLLFGLGFDTASEVAVLIIAAGAAAHGLPVWYCLMFPLLFGAGMTLVDSADSLLILSACRWAVQSNARSHYYNVAMTLTTVLMAFGIAAIEIWGLLAPQTHGRHSGYSWAQTLNSHFVAIGVGFVVITAAVWAILWFVWRLRGRPLYANAV